MDIFLAGCEMQDSQVIIKKGLIDKAFYSYFYLRRGGSMSEKVKEGRPFVRKIIIDSGAHSFFSASEQVTSATKGIKRIKKKDENPDIFFKGYLNWLIKNEPYYDFFVELDIGELIGQKEIMQWRKVLADAGLEKKMITVYHPKCITLKEFEQSLKDSKSRYVGLEGYRADDPRLPYLKLLKMAYDKGVKVHGFAMTKMEVVDKYPFYSVDSSSWKAGVRFGTGMVNNDGKPKMLKYKSREHVRKIGAILKLGEMNSANKKEQYYARLSESIEGYKRMEDQATRLWLSRGIDWEKQIKSFNHL